MVLVHLARIRRALGWSQADLAERAKVPQSCISNLERGLRVSEGELVERIADALGVQPEALTAERIQIDCSSVAGTQVTVTCR